MGFFGGGGGAAASNMVGATTSVAGTAGLVPAPAAGKKTRALFSDASFGEVPIVPQRKTTNIIREYNHYTSSNSNQYSGKIRPFLPIFVPADGNVGSLVFRTGAGTYSSAINFHIAMWECGQDGNPSSLVVDAVASSGTASSTDIVTSVSSTAVKRGFYYISLTPESTIPSNGINAANTNSFGVMFVGIANLSTTQAVLGYVATTYNQTTHETFSETAASVRPSVGFKYA